MHSAEFPPEHGQHLVHVFALACAKDMELVIAVEVDVMELPGVLAALVAERCIRHDSRVFSGVCCRERG